MDSSFQDSIRQAAGLPTTAEIAARKADEEQAARARADDEPRQQALTTKFNSTIAPMIDQVFTQAAAALADAEFRLIVAPTYPGELLADKAFTVEPKPRPPIRGRLAQVVLVSPLHFGLHADGNVSAAAPDVSSAPPTLRVGLSTIKRPMEDFTPALIGSIFTDYIKVAARVIRSAREEQ